MFLGISVRIVEFKPLGRKPLLKKECTAVVKYFPIPFQEDLKNSLVNPSGPGDLLLGMWKTTSLISSSVTVLTNLPRSSSLHLKGGKL